MSNAENSDMVEVEPAPSPAPRIEYRQSNNKKTAINKYFFVQHLNGLPTDKLTFLFVSLKQKLPSDSHVSPSSPKKCFPKQKLCIF